MISLIERMSVNRRTVLAGTAAVGGSYLLPASARAQDSQPTRGGTLLISMPYNPAALDPLTGRNNPDFNSLFTIYDTLIDFDPETLELKPMLAKSWEFTGPTTLVLELEEGVEFHDGEPFNAEAVVFHLERCVSNPRSNVKSDVSSIEKVEATGTHQVSVNIAEVTAAADQTGGSAQAVHGSANHLAGQSGELKKEVENFLQKVRAA